MKKILVPTDFSELGNFAYDIASLMAKGTNAEIIALSVIPGPRGAIYADSGELLNDDDNDYSEWTKRLVLNKTKMNDWIADKPDVKTGISTIGNIDNAILECSESNDVDLIVMGTEGVYNTSIWSKASHTEYISNHSEIPVLSLKCDRKNLNLKEILLVNDFLAIDKLDLSILKTIQKMNDSKLVLLKVKTSDCNKGNEEISDDMKVFAEVNELENYTLSIYEDNSVESGIGKYSAENDIDLIALGTHQGLGISKLFKGSVSDDVVNHLYHPILTFPLN